MSKIDSIMTGDGTICLIADGRHYTVSSGHVSYAEIRQAVLARPLDENRLRSLLDINQQIKHICQGKVRVSLDESKVWYNDTEFHDDAFCQRILRLMSEGQDVNYLVNFLNNVGQNPEFRAVMETFKFLCHLGLPITPDGCFLAYKGVAGNFYDKWTGKILNQPDGRRIEEPRELMDNDPSHSCAKGLHCGSVEYGRSWGGADGHCVLVKVNPRDVVCVPNHDSGKMRVCGYWVIKVFDEAKDNDVVLEGEVYDSLGNRVAGSKFTGMEARGEFDNDVNSHWGEEEGRVYGNDIGACDEYEEEERLVGV
jgi:hypothetical protein